MFKAVDFLKTSVGAGVLLMLCALAAVICANFPPLQHLYHEFLHFNITVGVGGRELSGGLHFWVSDGLMAIFFLFVALEIKRELISGELSSMRRVMLPAAAAVGGMIAPAAIYVLFNFSGGDDVLHGWAVPIATDIAFSLSVLALLGSRVPIAMKVFLTTVAVIDDLLAILIIAFFYAGKMQPWYLVAAALIVIAMLVLGRIGVVRLAPYLILGALLWIAMKNSGIHATIAGVLTAACIPHKRKPESISETPLQKLEHALHQPVALLIMPLFAFVNAGVEFAGLNPSDLLAPLPLGIALGLVVGKPVGICAAVGLALLCGVGKFPPGLNWERVFGVALLCGIGFTVSLFIGNLAFQDVSEEMVNLTKLGVLSGSLIAGIGGWLFLHARLRG